MKSFSKNEIGALAIILLVLVVISIPNYLVSFRRARDQVRKDDMGAMQKVLGTYQADFGTFPLASEDGRIVACKTPGETITKDKFGRLVGNIIPCDWGKDALVDLAGDKVYMPILPREPNYQKGPSYRYFSDGSRTQMLVALEGVDEPEYDEAVIARGIMCGNLICNAGRDYGCPVFKSLEECRRDEEKALNK